jgi:DNA polymerase I-like protein with 3'-5' exonuclease and polymerase domains
LTQIGYNIVGFVHDEIIIELPEGSDYDAQVSMIEKVMCDAMKEVTGGKIPISCSSLISSVWSKNANQVKDANGKLVAWNQPAETSS